ncbi:g4031 [Coccomyxa elongata]
MSPKAVFAHMFLNAIRGVRMIGLRLRNVMDEELDRTAKAKSHLNGICAERLFVHGFTVQAGGLGAEEKQRGKTARWELDGYMRHAILELCAAGKVADYMLLRFRDLPLQPALVSAEALLAFPDQEVFYSWRCFASISMGSHRLGSTLLNTLSISDKPA